MTGKELGELKANLLLGDRRALAKAITLVESKLADHRVQAEELIEHILPHTGKSFRIGISGAPGVGKSTFIENLGSSLAVGNKVAVLAVDPSSPITGGSIMGDKTRMERLVQSANAFIRPSPSGGNLGGVAQRTRESILLCEAAGFTHIFVETVGVGQSEVDVAHMVDCFLVLLLPSAGDELQGIKKGIIELADLLVVHKAEGANLQAAQRTQNEYQAAMHLLRAEAETKVLLASSQPGSAKEIEESAQKVWSAIQNFYAVKSGEKEGANYKLDLKKLPSWIVEKRTYQQEKWFRHLVQDSIQEQIQSRKDIAELWKKAEEKIRVGSLSPITGARQIIKALFQ